MSQIVDTLDKLISAYKAKPWPMSPLRRPEEYPPELWEPYVKSLRSSSEMSIFDDQMQVIGAPSRRVDMPMLARWLFDRGLLCGSDQAVQDLHRYICNDTFAAHKMMLLCGLLVKQEHDLGNGVALIPPRSIPSTLIRDAVLEDDSKVLPTSRITAALVLPFEHPRLHYKPDDEPKSVREFTQSIADFGILEDTRLCLSLVGSFGPQFAGVGIVPSDEVPNLCGTGWYLGAPSHSTPRPLIEVQATQARELYEQFTALEPHQKDKLRIPLRHINVYADHQYDIVQSAIALRVALDALFLDQRKDELIYRLSLHAALYLGGTHEEKKRNRKIIKDAYSLGSLAIHNGNFTSKELKKNPGETLDEAAKLVREAAKRMIRNPAVDWDALELTGGVPDDET